MTSTHFFKTFATNRSTGVTKVFYGFFIKHHHAAAVAWLRG